MIEAGPARSLDGLAPPPRAVPLDVRLDELFGGTWSLLGWIFTAAGLPFVLIFVLNGDFSGWRFHGGLETATARVSACRGTSFSEGGSKHSRGHPIYETEFFFRDAAGATIVESSYGQTCYQPGQDAPVEFPRGRPDLARVSGLRRAPMGPSVAWILLFPAIGLAFIVAALRQGLRDIRLLSRGVVARGAVVGKRQTNIREDNRPLWELDVAFKDSFGKERVFKTRTCFPEKLEQGAVHPVFYDPDRPEDAVAADTLPEPLFADFSGGLSSDGWARAARALFVPAVTLLGLAVYVGWRLRG